MLEIRHGRASEYNRIIDFIDFVFSKNSCPHDFPRMYPNLYRETDESMNNLVNLWEDGELMASVLVYPRTLCVGGQKLKICGIGSVASHPRFRGRGYMTTLLNHINDEMKADGVHLSNLGGRRSRYNHFGYEITGNAYALNLSGDGIKSVLPEYDGSGYTFSAFKYEDRDVVGKLMEIYASKPLHYDYDYDDFFLRLVIPTDGAEPFAVYDGGRLLGYIAVCPRDGDHMFIREICLEDDELISDVLMSYAVSGDWSLDLKFAEYQLRYIRKLLDYSSDININGSGMWEVLDWPGVIKALLTHKSEYTTLERGTLVLDIENSGRYAVCFDGREVSVETTDDEPDFVFPGLSATRALLGPVPPAFFGLDCGPRKTPLVKSWFPLPLTWFNTERV